MKEQVFNIYAEGRNLNWEFVKKEEEIILNETVVTAMLLTTNTVDSSPSVLVD